MALKFLSNLQKHPVSKVTLKAYFGDAECQNLSEEIKEVFEKAGWTIAGHIFAIPKQPIRGVVIGVPSSDKESPASVLICNWLATNFPKTTAELVPDDKGYIVFVGQNI